MRVRVSSWTWNWRGVGLLSSFNEVVVVWLVEGDRSVWRRAGRKLLLLLLLLDSCSLDGLLLLLVHADVLDAERNDDGNGG